MNVRFKTANEMADSVMNNHDYYNEKTGIYCFRYNESGSICYYRLTNEQAIKTAEKVRKTGETYWGAALGPGGYILDDPEVIAEFFRDNYKEDRWVIADASYGNNTYRKYYVLKAGIFPNEKTYMEIYLSFEEAYDKMCDLYIKEKDDPNRWGIYRVTEYNGNKAISPVWN